MSCVSSESEEEETTWIFSDSYTTFQEIDIRNHSRSLLRFTYRSHFPALAPYSYTSDAGWGCMLRSAQMLIGQTMQRHYLGQDWRIPSTTSTLRADEDYCNIVRWCTDYPGPSCIYAIHHLIQCGMMYDKLPGEWFGPSTASLVLRDLTRLHRRKYHGPIEAHVTTGDTIYVTEVEKTFTAIKAEEVDPLGNDVSKEHIFKKKRRSRRVHKEDNKDHPPKSGSKRREDANQRVIPERSEGSVASSLESYDRDLEDEVNSYTFSSESCGSRNQSIDSVTASMEECDKIIGESQHCEFNDQSNPFILDREKKHSVLSSCSNLPQPIISKSLGDSPSRTLTTGPGSYSGIDLKPCLPQAVRGESGNLQSLIAENMTLYDPILNPPPPPKEEEWPASLLLLLPLRLGLDKFNPAYIPAIKQFLRNRNSVGILGGQVNRAIYFVGYRGNTLLGLDPHTVYKNPSLSPPFPSKDHISQIHRQDLHELNFDLLDPSLALAFYFRDRYEFKAFCDETIFMNEQKAKDGQLSLYQVKHAPATMDFNVDVCGFCNSDSDGKFLDSFLL